MITSNTIFNIASKQEFEAAALAVFKFQFNNNIVYRAFCDLLYKHPADITKVEDIPFLPISFFKSHNILSSKDSTQKTFTSSGTTGANVSKHHVTDLSIYERSFTKAFHHFYGNIEDYVVLALLPSYLERDGSSLIYMADHLIKASKHKQSGFYLDNYSQLNNTLQTLNASKQKVLLIGVSFALLDLVETYNYNLLNTIIMETGGMKGRRKELIRPELHHILNNRFGVKTIHSEYGMTELLSQAYSNGHGIFKCPPWMKIFTRDTTDALKINTTSASGGINIIDLANVNSCSFIATQDLGKTYDNGTFEVLGRFDNADIRGCNLMIM